jgi:uncharacterized RDD family membrane protein YckC
VAEFFFVVPPLGNSFASNVFEGNKVDFWRDGYGWGSCEIGNVGSYEGSAEILPSCQLPGVLRLSIPDPSKHVELMVESERPTGEFPGEQSIPRRPTDFESTTIPVPVLFSPALILVVLGMASEGAERRRESLGDRQAPRRPEPRPGTEREALRRRILAALVDAGVVLALYSLLISGLVLSFLPVAGVLELMEAVFTITLVFSPLAFIIYMAVWMVYASLLEGLYGQTIGKRLMGVVVTRIDGSPITLPRSLLRNVLRYLDGVGVYLVGLIFMLLTRRKQRIGDKVAGTVVLRY